MIVSYQTAIFKVKQKGIFLMNVDPVRNALFILICYEERIKPLVLNVFYKQISNGVDIV